MKTIFSCVRQAKTFIVVVDGETHTLRYRNFANTNQKLADKLNVNSRDIPRLRKCCGVGTSSEVIHKLLEMGFVSGRFSGMPDTDISRILGIGRHKVAEVRNSLNVQAVKPSDFRNRRADWGSVSEELRDPNISHHQVGDLLGVSSISVYRRRKRLVESNELPEAYMTMWGKPGKQAREEI